MKLFYTLLFSLLATAGWSQILEPVTWEMTTQVVSADEYDLVFTAQMDEGWSIYSQYTADDGPIPTSFNFDDGAHYTRVGEVAEKGKKKEGPDPLFDNVVVIKFPHGPVVFTQRVKVSDTSQPIAGWLEFMTCDEERCLPPTEVDFSFDIASAAAPTKANETIEQEQEEGRTAVEKAPEASAEQAPSTAEAAETTTTVDVEPAELATGVLARATIKEGPTTDPKLLKPVRWQLDAVQTGENEYELIYTAHLDDNWSIYSQHTADDGPVPTAFYWDGEGYERIGEVSEKGDMKEGPDPLFGGVVVKKYAHGPVVFTQKVQLNGAEKIAGALEFMTCDNERCLPPTEVPFEVTMNPLAVMIGDGPGEPVAVTPTTTGPKIEGDRYGDEVFRTNIMNDAPLSECGGETEEREGKGLWQIFGLGFLGGLLALLTPCVFPMIPLTVSFFTKSSGTRAKGIQNAVLYGAFIFLVYLLLSVPFHLMDSLDPDILNKISTDVTLNVVFFLVFIFFAISFFGYFELTVPESWTNKASSAEGAGGLLGIFFMALTLALVSFSCTGPILGSLLVGALSGDGGATQLTAGMGGFGLALALPFALFASFPGMMKSLPRSGGWLNSVKVVLGFVELALALKFLSNADLVKHWDFLKIELFLGLWILIGIGLALYLFGKIKFPHDSPIKKLHPFRIGLGVLTVAFVIYLASGFRVSESSGSYQPLTLLSGLAPPVCYSYLRPCHCPQGLECFKDLEEGLAFAKKVNKPVMIDFTGYACVNCRKMEENVWPEPDVLPYLRDDYVVISLYVDDKKELETPLMVTKASGRERELDEVGELWSHFQEIVFEQNTQPQYALITPDGRRLNAPVSYTPDVAEYSEFLRCGLENFRRLSVLDKATERQLGTR